MRAHAFVALLLARCASPAVVPQPDAGTADPQGDAVRQQIVKPLGLVTEPNEYGEYPEGALSRALNVCMRAPGILSSLPDTQAYRADVMSSGYTVRALFPMAASVLAFGDSSGTWAARWVTSGASTSISAPSGVTLAFDTARAYSVKTRERVFTGSNSGPIAFDSEGDTSARIAGMPAPNNISANAVSATNAQVMADGKVARWRAMFRRIASDGYEIAGEVSHATEVTNSSGSTIDITFRIAWASANHAPIAGDHVELYRTYFQTSGTDPGDTYYLAAVYTLTSTDISNLRCDIRDTTLQTGLGAELYTNPGREGAAQTNMAPPLTDDIAVFKNYTLYGSRRTPSQLKTKVNSTFGTLTSNADRTYGIGRRDVTGDTTNLSPNVINVSSVLGLQAGQLIFSSQFPGGTTISSVGATSFVASANATATTVGSTQVIGDVLEINGITDSILNLAVTLNRSIRGRPQS